MAASVRRWWQWGGHQQAPGEIQQRDAAFQRRELNLFPVQIPQREIGWLFTCQRGWELPCPRADYGFAGV